MIPRGRPITPDEVREVKAEVIQPEVIDCFNELIAKAWDGRTAKVSQQAAVSLIEQRLDTSSTRIYEEHWLDVEGAFEAAGWSVVYDKPGYNESYPATFTFRRKR